MSFAKSTTARQTTSEIMKKPNDPIFNVGHQYAEYLKRVGVTEAQLHPVQRTEMKRAFYGAWGQALVLLRDEITAFDEDTGAEILQRMFNQVNDYWQREAGRQN